MSDPAPVSRARRRAGNLAILLGLVLLILLIYLITLVKLSA